MREREDVIEFEGERRTGKEWLEAGRARAERGELERARACLEEAVMADPLLTAAYGELKEVEEEMWRQEAERQRHRRARVARWRRVFQIAVLVALVVFFFYVLTSPPVPQGV
jgi:hypothetical protein